MRVNMWIYGKGAGISIGDCEEDKERGVRAFSTLTVSNDNGDICIYFDSLELIEDFLTQATLEVSAKLGAKGELHRIPVQD
ncbi:MAG: hypothetical protein HWN68_12865 [Desulfobacterales bacterium]|nr:hypothetical protein [Desulfobacterales bacterium]